jgi:hypothetical protein
MLTPQSGYVDDIFNRNELEYIIKYLSKLKPGFISAGGNEFSGIDKNHVLYSWFIKHIFEKIQATDAGKPAKILFGSYLHERTPWEVHSDYYHKKLGEPYMAFLIPLSVNNDMEQVDKSHTIIFNEIDKYVDLTSEGHRKGRPFLFPGHTETKKKNNATEIFEQHLSHINKDDLEYLSVKEVIPWKLGRVLYWSESLLHCSDDFVASGNTSKQAIVIHTYSDEDIK